MVFKLKQEKRMKKIIVALIAGLFLATNVYGADKSVIVNKRPTSTTPISAQLLDADPTSVTSSKVNISNYGRLGVYTTYDETEVGGVSAALTLQVSPNGTNWFAAPFFDTAGGATPQTSENFTADGSHVAWFDSNIPFNYARAIMTCTGCDADDTVTTSVYFYIDRG
jgi:hypothetical protein